MPVLDVKHSASDGFQPGQNLGFCSVNVHLCFNMVALLPHLFYLWWYPVVLYGVDVLIWSLTFKSHLTLVNLI